MPETPKVIVHGFDMAGVSLEILQFNRLTSC